MVVMLRSVRFTTTSVFYDNVSPSIYQSLHQTVPNPVKSRAIREEQVCKTIRYTMKAKRKHRFTPPEESSLDVFVNSFLVVIVVIPLVIRAIVIQFLRSRHCSVPCKATMIPKGQSVAVQFERRVDAPYRNAPYQEVPEDV